MNTWNGMRRTAIKRKPRAADRGDFNLVTVNGDVYRWPAKHVSEADWQDFVIDCAFLGDQDTEVWHCKQTRLSKAGWFDLAICQPKRKVGLLCELKARDRQGATKQASADQKRYIAAAIACGYDVRLWLYPDDEREAFETLTGRPWSEVQA